MIRYIIFLLVFIINSCLYSQEANINKQDSKKTVPQQKVPVVKMNQISVDSIEIKLETELNEAINLTKFYNFCSNLTLRIKYFKEELELNVKEGTNIFDLSTQKGNKIIIRENSEIGIYNQNKQIYYKKFTRDELSNKKTRKIILSLQKNKYPDELLDLFLEQNERTYQLGYSDTTIIIDDLIIHNNNIKDLLIKNDFQEYCNASFKENKLIFEIFNNLEKEKRNFEIYLVNKNDENNFLKFNFTQDGQETTKSVFNFWFYLLILLLFLSLILIIIYQNKILKEISSLKKEIDKNLETMSKMGAQKETFEKILSGINEVKEELIQLKIIRRDTHEKAKETTSKDIEDIKLVEIKTPEQINVNYIIETKGEGVTALEKKYFKKEDSKSTYFYIENNKLYPHDICPPYYLNELFPNNLKTVGRDIKQVDNEKWELIQ